jgi:hypothetical protein
MLLTLVDAGERMPEGRQRDRLRALTDGLIRRALDVNRDAAPGGSCAAE